MKKILLFLLLPLFSFSQDRQCVWEYDIRISFSVNDSINHHILYSIDVPYPATEYYDSSFYAFEPDSLTFYYQFGSRSFLYSEMGGFVHNTDGLFLIHKDSITNGAYCWGAGYDALYYTNSQANDVAIYVANAPNNPLSFHIDWIKDSRDRNINVKLSSNSSLNITTQKGNQTLRMFSLNGQLVYSYSFDAAEYADVNISLAENIFPSGIYILSLVSATEAQNFKVFVQ